MNKTEAQNLIGKKVSVWTSMNGTYVGVVQEIISEPKRPWGCNVLITGVLEPAFVYEYSRGLNRQRRGYRIGEIINAGGQSVSETNEKGVDYLLALRFSLKDFVERAYFRIRNCGYDAVYGKNGIIVGTIRFGRHTTPLSWILGSIHIRKNQILDEIKRIGGKN